MKLVIQRVRSASVEVNAKTVANIGVGLLVFVGAAKGDGEHDVNVMAEKVPVLRIFPDSAGRMNRSLFDVGGELLVVSQFTLLGNTEKGRRPSFDEAALPDVAHDLYERFVARLKAQSLHVQTGIFGTDMLVTLQNDGPVTFILDSQKGGGVLSS
ncbi:MAG: D-tyrosyl-tRNA(Tyr) deacylase [Nitrospirales bacterium]|nr:D-tyrosyl-tRNA(Tyr) deacylase [Nitrospirales bacterium]